MLTTLHRTPFDLLRLPGLFDDVRTPRAQDGAARPALDLTETEAGYELTVDLPGVREDDVDLSVHDDLVTVRAERRVETSSEDPAEGESPKRLRVERHQARFQRRLQLPRPVDAERVAAHLEHGVLRVSLPFAVHATPRKVPVLGATRPTDTDSEG